MSDTVLYAHEYIRRGWAVFPVSPDKTPLTKNGFKDASLDPDQIELWWGVGGKLRGSNIAIRTGANSIIVVDADKKSGGLDSLRNLVESGKLPPTVTAFTGGGGLHLCYLPPGIEVPNSTSAVAPGIDIRGDGGYVVAPPSIHLSGNPYTWEVTPSDIQMALFPIDILPAGKAKPTFKARDVFTEGMRNASLVRLAGQLKRQDFTIEQIRAQLHAVNNAAPTPLPTIEVDSIADRTTTWPSAPPTQTEIGQAEFVAQFNQGRIIYDSRSEMFMTWNGMHWRKTDTIYQYIKDGAREVGQIAVEEATKAKTKEDKERAQSLKDWARGLESAGRVTAVTSLLSQEVRKESTELDLHPYLLGVPNGVVDLQTGDLVSGIPDHWITQITRYPYDKTADCPRWKQYIVEVARERGGKDRPALEQFLKRAGGYTTTGDTSRSVWFLCLGGGSNGKSTFLEALFEILGEYSRKVSIKSITLRTNRRATDDDIAKLEGGRFLLSDEAGQSSEMDSERIKMIVDHDATVEASQIYKKDKRYRMTGHLWMPNNRPPRCSDDTDGYKRRILAIPFDQKFAVDPMLKDIIRSEYVGILTWLVEGAREYLANGLNPPPEVIFKTATINTGNDQLMDWYDTLIQDPAGTLGDRAAFDDYQNWCSSVNIEQKERKWRMSVSNYLVMRHEKKGNYFQGVRLRDDTDNSVQGEEDGEAQAESLSGSGVPASVGA